MLYFNNQDSKWSRLPQVPSAELIRKFHHQNPSMHFFFSFLWSLMKISNVVFHWVWKAPLVVTCPGSISDLVLPSPPGPSFSCCSSPSNLLHSLCLRILFSSKARPNYPLFHLCSTFPSFPIHQLLPTSIFLNKIGLISL